MLFGYSLLKIPLGLVNQIYVIGTKFRFLLFIEVVNRLELVLDGLLLELHELLIVLGDQYSFLLRWR